MTRGYLGLGSNLGDRAVNLKAAIESLDWGPIAVVARSSVYETDPVDAPDGSPDFLNQVIAIDTDVDARAVWDRCASVELALGRSREHERRYGPRTIDIDVLLVGDEVVDEPDLTVPHARMAERAFVLVPLVELAPDVHIPGVGTAAARLEGLSDHGVRRWEGSA